MKYTGHLFVLFDALVEHKNLLFFCGKLFTGVALFTKSGIIIKRSHVEQGVLKHDYVPPYSNLETVNKHLILDDVVDEFIEPQMVNQKIFTGMLYSNWKNGWIEREQVYTDGICTEGASYHINSNRYSELALDTANTVQLYQFCEQGKVTYWHVAYFNHNLIKNNGEITCRLNSHDGLLDVSLSGSFSEIPSLHKEVKYPNVSFIDIEGALQFKNVHINSLSLTEVNEKDLKHVAAIISTQHIKEITLSDFDQNWLEVLSLAYSKGMRSLKVYTKKSEDILQLQTHRDKSMPELSIKF
ncbi:hypothetical protein A7985_07700 [Pseudoalteromonas luteoviolacea]|uniref:Uncharacterized protein n=1 Tax=Pseudoalteromonas luteoviolacea TaxID=43657 RepID=A0A1C0TWW4_9GAMM|nr:hypothetical protein [Pseudoalteromonas luteoviolacea]OCQ23813.1 hypothetical protein A7985_07700 [Pseudoalteromonas luteoviolacea]